MEAATAKILQKDFIRGGVKVLGKCRFNTPWIPSAENVRYRNRYIEAGSADADAHADASSTTNEVCVAWFAYGNSAKSDKYHQQAIDSMKNLKERAKGVRSVFVTDRYEFFSTSSEYDFMDTAVPIPTGWDAPPPYFSWFRRKQKKDPFLHRAVAITYWEEIMPSCQITLAVDATTTYCGGPMTLRNQLLELLANPKFEVGTNVEHAPFPIFDASPYKAPRRENPDIKEILPHNCALAWRRADNYANNNVTGSGRATNGDVSRQIRLQWLARIRIGGPPEVSEDQKALQYVIYQRASQLQQEKGEPGDDNDALYRTGWNQLSQNLATAFHTLQRKKYGAHPRFTYLIPNGTVSLLHSSQRVPPGYQDICEFLNSDLRPRIVWQHDPSGSMEFLFNFKDCIVKEKDVTDGPVIPGCFRKERNPKLQCAPQEPYVCEESFPH